MSLLLSRAIEKVDASGNNINTIEFETATCTPESLQIRNHPAFKYFIAAVADEDQSDSPDMVDESGEGRWSRTR